MPLVYLVASHCWSALSPSLHVRIRSPVTLPGHTEDFRMSALGVYMVLGV